MITVKGKYSEAQIYTDFVGEDTINQLYEILNQEFTKGSKIRIMPDCHIGKGCVIGTTMTITDKVVPSLVGVDIGCGMHVVKLGKIDIDFKMIDDFIHEYDDEGAKYGIKDLEKHVKINDLKCSSHIKKQSYIIVLQLRYYSTTTWSTACMQK